MIIRGRSVHIGKCKTSRDIGVDRKRTVAERSEGIGARGDRPQDRVSPAARETVSKTRESSNQDLDLR